MIARILSRLKFWLSRERLRQAYSQAWMDHRDALNRGDTRTIHATRTALTQANTAILKAEVGCRGIGLRGSR